MNNSKKMTEIIEKKKELSQEKTPKYGTRKLSIGLVSCMLGFSLIIAPGSSKAAEASENETVATETKTPEENPVEEATPVANEEIKTEETKEEVVAKQADTFVENLQTIEVEEGEEIDYKQAVTNLPQDAKLDVVTPVDTKEAGEKTTSAKITFADGSVKEIQIKVNVKAVEAKEEAEDLEFSEKVERQPAKVPESPKTGVRDAAPPEDTTTTPDAKNAVHGYVGVQAGGDLNLPLGGATGQQFKPIGGVKVYFQWFEKWSNGKEYTSPVYSATSGADGQFHMGIKSYVAPDGNLIRFDADTTVSAGNERYKMWVDESTIPDGYALQYMTGEGVVFPDSGLPITQGGSGSDTTKNTHVNWKVLLRQKPKNMHKEQATDSPVASKTGGNISGNVSWDYSSGVGGIHWQAVADKTSPAKDVVVKASYLSDYAMKKIFSDETAKMLNVDSPSKIRGIGWTAALEQQLQEWIQGEVAKDPDNWIAETVQAKTNAEGNYIIQFNGTWGPDRNYDAATKERKAGNTYDGWVGHKWTEEEVNRLGTIADDANSGTFATEGVNYWNRKHINDNWIYISTEGTDHLRVMTPFNNNYYTYRNDNYGINVGWNLLGKFEQRHKPNNSFVSDFALAPQELKFNVTNYDSGANTATPGDVAQTATEGLPYSGVTSDTFRIVWYDEDGNVVNPGKVQKPNGTGHIESEPFDTKGVDKTTTFTAKLYRVDSKGNNTELLAQDSFTVVVEDSKKITSMYDEFEYKNPNPLKGATYSAKGLPDGLEIDPKTGDIKGVPTESGKFQVEVITVVPDESGDITASRFYTYTVTDSPLKDGNVGTEYNKKVEPKPIDGYVFKNVTAKFIDGKAIDGLTIKDGVISGTPTSEVGATQDTPNVEVTYDIYILNEKGEEVLIKKGHVDRVPLSIKEGKVETTAEKVQPEYTEADAVVGKQTTITAPNFKDDKGQDTTKPDGTKFALGKDAPEGAKINPETGEITYTPTEAEAGNPVEIPVVVTYKDGSTDEVNANVTVAALDDIIDRTGNEDKPTPKGYVRVTFTNGDGVNDIANNKVYDVKEGTKLPADKYPTVTAKDGYENPTWSTKPGTAITKDNAKITAIATKKNEQTSAKPEINDVTENDTTITGKGVAGSDIVVTRGEDVIGETKVKDDGTWSVDVPAGETLAKDDEIVVTQTEKDKNPAEEKTTVKEKAPVAKPTLKANDDGSVTVTPPADKDVDVVQITYTDEKDHEGTLVATKGDDGQWKLPDGTDPSITINPDTGVVTIPANQVKDGSEVKAVAEKDGTPSDEAKVKAKNNPVSKKEITKWVQETADGKIIELKSEEGNKSDNDGVSDIPGYKFVRTDKKEDDTTITYTNVYKLLLGSKAVGLDGTELKPASIGYDKENPEQFKGYTYLFDEGESNPSDVEGQKAYLVNRIYAKNPAVVEVADTNSLTPDEQKAVKAAVKTANPDLLDNQISVNEKGEVTITRGKQTAKLDPSLTVVKQGQTPAPKITQPKAGDKEIKGKAEPGAKVEVKLPDGTKIETTADGEGNWTAKLPEGKELAENDVVKATATVDGKNPSDETTATTGKADPTEATAKPEITAPKAGDKEIKGKAEPNAKVEVKLPDGTKIETTADGEGNWTAKLPEGKELAENDVVKATATVDGKNPSDEVTATVGAKLAAPTVEANDDGSVTITPPVDEDVDSIHITYTDEKNEQGTLVVTKDDQGNWTLPQGTDQSITVDPTTGKVTIPADQVADGTVVTAFVQKGNDSSDDATATAKTPAENKSTKPEINPVKVDDKKITGTAKPNAIVNVTYPNGDVTEATADEQGNWSVDAPEGMTEGQTIVATATEDGKEESDKAETVVKGKGTKVSGDVKPVKPTDDKQDTGIKVENKDGDTKVTAKDEDGKDVPVEIDEDGNVIVTPGKNVDGPITVTIVDPDLPGGKVEIEVPVEGHEKGKDDNNSDKDGNKTIADKTNPTVPSKTEVKDKNNLTDEEKDKVKKAIEDANKDKFPQGTKVEIGKDGTATITYPDGSVDIIKGKDLVSQKANAGASGSINRVNSSNTGKNVKTGVGSSATILATLAAAVSGLFASKKRKND